MTERKTKTGIPIITIDGDDMVISKDQVMKSAAGYYIGQGYIEPMFLATDMTIEDVTEDMLQLPYDRDSGYYATRVEAEQALVSGNYFRI